MIAFRLAAFAMYCGLFGKTDSLLRLRRKGNTRRRTSDTEHNSIRTGKSICFFFQSLSSFALFLQLLSHDKFPAVISYDCKTCFMIHPYGEIFLLDRQ